MVYGEVGVGDTSVYGPVTTSACWRMPLCQVIRTRPPGSRAIEGVISTKLTAFVPATNRVLASSGVRVRRQTPRSSMSAEPVSEYLPDGSCPIEAAFPLLISPAAATDRSNSSAAICRRKEFQKVAAQ